MKAINNISYILIFLISFLVNAQDEELQSYFSNQLHYNIEQSQAYATNNSQRTSQQNSSTISLKQIGAENLANIYNRYAQGEHTVSQIGDKNKYQFSNYYNKQPINLGVLQTGNDNLLKIIGTNSMFQDLKIVQFGGADINVVSY